MIAPTGGNSPPRSPRRSRRSRRSARRPSADRPNAADHAKVVDREFKRDLDAYLAPYGKSTAGIVAFNDAHPTDTLKFGQARLRAAAAIDLSDPTTATAYAADLAGGRTASRAYVDGLLANGGAPVDAILSLTATTAEVGIRAGYPQITVPMGYDPTIRRPFVALVHRHRRRRREAARLRLRLRARGARSAARRRRSTRRRGTASRRSSTCRASCGPGELAPDDVPDRSACPRPSAAPCPRRSR